jgi:hypothetical protein
VRLAWFTLLALAATWQSLGKAGLFTETTDAQHFSLYEETARLTLTHFHELPLWNPYYCGGIPALGTPSARFASPTFLFTLLFGTLRAEPLILMAMTVVGLEGAYRYALARGGGAAGALLAAPIFALCGCFARWQSFAWTNFYGFQLVPWVLLGFRDLCRGSRRGVLVFASTLAWMIGFGGTYAAPITALATVTEAIQALLARRHRPGNFARLAAAVGAAAAFALALSLFRLWPVAENLSASPRVLGGTEWTTLESLRRDLFGDPAQKYLHGDYLAGLFVLPLFLLGGLRRRAMPILITSLFWLWLALGYGVKPSLFALLRTVPPYTMLRAPERILPLFVLGFAVVTSLALRRLEVLCRRAPTAVLLVLGSVGVFGMNLFTLVRNASETAKARTMIAPPAVVHREFRQTRGNRWLAFYYAEASRGTLACFDDYNVAESPDLRGDLPHEEYLKDTDAGMVTETAWAPGRLELKVALLRPARVYVNQNWHPGWRASRGIVVADHGLLAIDLPAGVHDVVLRFLPRSAILGSLASLAAVCVGVYVWRQTRNSDRFGSGAALARQVGLFASPLLLPLFGLLFWREPRRPQEPMLTPDGEPIVVSLPPADATRILARWVSSGITLEAVRLKKLDTSTDRDTRISVELDWRFDKKPPSGVGVFVHIEGGSSNLIALDHAFLSGTILIDDAPLHTTLRDVSEELLIPNDKDPKEMKVFVGLFYARRDGARLMDIQADAPVERGRISVGSFSIP